jgi:uracil-DNA glycosylase
MPASRSAGKAGSLAAPDAPVPRRLADLPRAEAECRRCQLYEGATRVVPGEGAEQAALMLVGEQPGDREDIAGKPFVGPAGRILDRALEAAGIAREKVFITNAVKHFRYEQRGKRRLHKRPGAYEIERCQWWLDLERTFVQPAVIVAMGATAVRSLLHSRGGIAGLRGRPQYLADGNAVLVTIHPSLLLRIRDEPAKETELQGFVADLRLGGQLAGLIAG